MTKEKEDPWGYLVIRNVWGGDVRIPLDEECAGDMKEWLGGEDESFCPNPFEI